MTNVEYPVRADYRHGKWEDVLAGVDDVDTIITDPPYSAKTHTGHASGTASANRVTEEDEQRLRVDNRNGRVFAVGKHRRRAINYAPWAAEDVRRFVEHWSPRTRGWFVAFCDHVLAPHWIEALEEQGRYVFSPLAFMATGSRVRMRADGPAQWSVWIIAARPRTQAACEWRSLPGGYVLPAGQPRKQPVVGGKPLWLMRSLVRDYSNPRNVVCDPCAGGATTLLAARMMNRHSVGAEASAENFALGKQRMKEHDEC
jgi:DNA modification methylase